MIGSRNDKREARIDAKIIQKKCHTHKIRPCWLNIRPVLSLNYIDCLIWSLDRAGRQSASSDEDRLGKEDDPTDIESPLHSKNQNQRLDSLKYDHLPLFDHLHQL